MADKQVNININYKVNTVEVEKAQGLLKQAQTASNTFEASAKKAGTSTAAAFNTAGLSIQEMNAKLIVLKERINTATDPKKVAALSEQYKKLKNQLDEVNKAAFQTPKALKETSTATQSLSNQLGGLYTAVKLAFTAGIIKEVVTTSLEMAKLAGNVEGVERAFQRAFPDSESLMFRLKNATHNTVNEFELMQRTLQATNLGVAVEQLPILFEFAAARAQQTGESVDYLVDSIVRGIGRKSILVLDNLGLSATRLREEFNGASLASQSVGDVTRGVAEIAKVELQKMGGYAETSATKVDSLTASFANLKAEVAKSTTGDGDFITLIKQFVDSYTDLFEAKSRNITVSDLLVDRLIKEQAQTVASEFMDRRFGKSKEENNKILQEEIKLITKEIGEWAKNRDAIDSVINSLKNEKVELNNRVKNHQISSIQASERLVQISEEIAAKEKLRDEDKNSILVLQDLVKVYQATLIASNKNTDALKEQLGIIEQLQVDIETLGDRIKKATSVSDIERLNRELVRLEFRLKELNELGKNRIDPLASVTFDIKANLSQGKIKLKANDLISSKELQADTDRLGKELGESFAKSFDLGASKGIDRMTEFEQALQDRKGELISAGIDITANALNDLAQMELDNYDIRLQNLRDYYDNQIYLAGNNEKAKDKIRQEEKKKTDKLRREEAKKEQQARLFAILLNTAAGIAKAFATSATIYDAYVNAAIVAVEGAAQYAVASKAPRGFAKGVLNLDGKGNGTSDSIPAKLSKGESVMTAKEWQTSKNVLKEVRAKKLDDNVLADLKLSKEGVKYVGGFNDKNLLSKLDEVKNSMPDVEERAGLLYTTKKKGENYRMWVRKSSMSS